MTKRYAVRVTEQAQQDVQAIHDHIANDNPMAASKWVDKFKRHARSLSQLPDRFSFVPESVDQGYPFREIIFGAYRIIYWVEEDHVAVVRVVHSAKIMNLRSFLGDR